MVPGISAHTSHGYTSPQRPSSKTNQSTSVSLCIWLIILMAACQAAERYLGFYLVLISGPIILHWLVLGLGLGARIMAGARIKG